MIVLKCPQCGRTEEMERLPVDLALPCSACNVVLVVGESAVAHPRDANWRRTPSIQIAAASLGVLALCIVTPTGHGILLALGRGMIGAIVGSVVGFLFGIIAAVDWRGTSLVSDPVEQLTFYMVIGFVGGFVFGVATTPTSPIASGP